MAYGIFVRPSMSSQDTCMINIYNRFIVDDDKRDDSIIMVLHCVKSLNANYSMNAKKVFIF